MLTFPSKYGNSRESLHKISSLTNRNIIHFPSEQNSEYLPRFVNRQMSENGRRFSSWSLQRWCCECSHISVLGQWQLVTPGPRCHQLTHHPAYTFCCKSPATRQEGHIYFDVVRRRIYFAIHVFFHFPVLLMPYCSEHLIPNSVWTILSQGSVFLDNLYLQIFKSYKLCKNANFRSVMARKYERNFCMANIMLHKKLCKKRNLSTYCLPVCLLANINIVLETPFFPFYHVSQPHNS